MGYWESNDGLWGDPPADVMGDALQEVVVSFLRDVRRLPTKQEIRDGLEFTLRGMALPEDVPDELTDDQLQVIDADGYAASGGDLPYNGRSDRQRAAGKRVLQSLDEITTPYKTAGQ
jgi:hypothetical protein